MKIAHASVCYLHRHSAWNCFTLDGAFLIGNVLRTLTHYRT